MVAILPLSKYLNGRGAGFPFGKLGRASKWQTNQPVSNDDDKRLTV
jgi:hypothetical protein